jgi:hypothetical protein
MFVRSRSHLGYAGRRGWKRYSEQVVQRKGNGAYEILLKEISGLGYLGSSVNTGGIVSAGAGAGSGVAASAAGLGLWAGPIGAGVGAVVGIIAALWSAHDARVKGAKEENQIVGDAVSTWDQGMQAIFSAANSGQITGAQAAQLCSQLLASYWTAVEQAKGLPGVADDSGYGTNCGSYTSGQTTPCTPSGAPKCNKSCTVGCCVGCNDLYPSTLDAIAVLSSPTGGSFETCTVYSSSFGLAQRNGYQLTYTPPAPSITGSAAQAGNALASAAGFSPTSTILGIPVWMLFLGVGGLVLYEVL